MRTKQLAGTLLIFGVGLLFLGLVLSVATSTRVSASSTLSVAVETPCVGCHIDWQLSSHNLALETPIPLSTTESCMRCHIDMASTSARRDHLNLSASRGIDSVEAAQLGTLQQADLSEPELLGEPGASPDSFSPLQDWNTP